MWWCLEIVRDPLFCQLGFVADDLFERFCDLRLERGTHEWDINLRGVVVGQGGGVAFAGEHDVAGEVHRGALDVAGEAQLGGFAFQGADVDGALELEVLGDHGLRGFGQDGLWQDFEEDGGGAVELIELARFGGKLLRNVLPVFLGGVRLVHLCGRLVDGYGDFTTCSHG